MNVALATDTVQRAHVALVHGDHAETVATCDSSVRWTAAAGLPFGAVYNGIDEVEAYFNELVRHFSSLVLTLTEVVSTRDTVVEQGTYHGVARETGIAFEVPFCVIWQVREGRIVEVSEYGDTATLNAALSPHFTN